MLLNSIAAIGKYPPGLPTGLSSTVGVGTLYNAGLGGNITVAGSAPTNLGRDVSSSITVTINMFQSPSFSQIATQTVSLSQFATGVTFTGLDVTKTYISQIYASNSAGGNQTNVVQPSGAQSVHSAPQAGGGGITIGGVGSGTISASFTPWSSTSSAPYSSSAATPGNGNLAITSIGVGRYDVTLANDEGYSLGYSNSSPVTMAASSFTKGHTYQLYLVAQNADGISYPSSYSGTFKPNP